MTQSAPRVVMKVGLIPDWLVVSLGLVLVAALAIPRLPPGICFADSGDLQVAAATLGMTHPPGYAGFVTVGFLATLIPGVQPTYAVTLACLATALLALALVARLQIRLGVNAWFAAAVMLELCASTRIWEALIIPEVYAPNLALHAAAVWFFVTYVQTGRLRRLVLAALLLGFAVANRPSAWLSVPGFVLALFLYCRQNHMLIKRQLRLAGVALLLLLTPCLYPVAYYYIRDSSDTPLNIIENWRIAHQDLPPATAGPAARLERALWLATAREYHSLLDPSREFVARRERWLIERLELSDPLAVIAATSATLIGAVIAWRRCQSAAIVLISIALGTAAFFCVYRVFDTAADVLPIMFAAAVFIGLAVSALVPPKPALATPTLGIFAFVAAAVCMGLRAAQPVEEAKGLDATHFKAAEDLRNLPQNAAVLSTWEGLPPLRYAQHWLNRPDLMVLTPYMHHEIEVTLRLSGAGYPLFSTMRFGLPPGFEFVPRGELWHIRPMVRTAADAERAVAPEHDDDSRESTREH